MRVLHWLFRAFLFFVLFAFALNNQHEVQLKWFFGYEWRAPMVLVVLAVFGAGCALGVLGMMPGWWRRPKVAAKSQAAAPVASGNDRPQPTDDLTVPGALPFPPRDGL